tara:strand:+ start:20537 stop:21787 length:1251 start_codon:yes stop_codon:yes gene_type:complete
MIDLKNNKTYCPYLFRGAVMQVPDGSIVPCCRYKDDGQVYPKSFDKGYKKIWETIRNKSLNGKKIKGCWRCYQDEEAGIKSMRESAIDTNSEISYDYNKDPKYSETELEFLEIQTGRFCNLKCRSCGPKLSTTWDEDLDKNESLIKNFFGNEHHEYITIKQLPKTNESLSSIKYDTVKHLKNVKATGGEPFLNDQFQTFLSNLVKWDLAKNIHLEVFTNCSFFPKEQYRKLIPQFKSAKIDLSLDAIGERAEFLRKGSQWKKVMDSATEWVKVSQQHLNVSVVIGHTLTIYNVLYLKEFINWIADHFPKEIITKDFLDLHLAQTPQYLSLSNFSSNNQSKIKEIVQQHKKQLISTHNNNEVILSIVEKSYSKVSKGLNYISNDLSNEFLEKANLIDDVRSENWRTTFPELAEVIHV